MGDLTADAALTDQGDGTYSADLSRDWEIWGPNGGYMAALALDAAHRATGRPRPANATVHFLSAASFDDWDDRRDQDPVYLDWIRFVSVSDAGPWAEAARQLLLVDLGAWPAATRTHVQSEYIAPSIDVSCEFHHLDPNSGWYLLRGESPVAGGGLIASHQEVWDDQGRLLASGISHLLCRPIR